MDSDRSNSEIPVERQVHPVSVSFSTGSNPKQRARAQQRETREIREDNRAAASQKGYNWNLGVSRIIVGNKTYSRNQIAAGTRINRSHIARIFKGKSRVSIGSGLRIASFLGINLETLLGVVIPSNIRNSIIDDEKAEGFKSLILQAERVTGLKFSEINKKKSGSKSININKSSVIE